MTIDPTDWFCGQALQVPSDQRRKVAVDRWYFSAIAPTMIAVSFAGFLPAIVKPEGRRAPLTMLVVAHGIVYLAWLVLFFVQSTLIATRHVAMHRRLGVTGAFLLALMIPLGYVTTIEMVRRGFDLSGDQHIDHYAHAGYVDPQNGAVFNLCFLAFFAALAAAALIYRRRSEIHKRLMLFANIELVGAPIAHFWGHLGVLSPASVLVPMAILMSSCVCRDYLVIRRVHPLTTMLSITLFVMLPIQASVIEPSAAWHQLVGWLAR
jgi:hypothetical protein